MAAAVIVALLLQATAAPLVPEAADVPVARANHARNLEAFASPDIEKSAPTAIVALSRRQLQDPAFRPLANQLGDALQRQGFNIVERGKKYDNVVTLDYHVYRDDLGELPGQSTGDPRVTIGLGPAHFPVHRRVTVTAYSLRDRAHAQVLWRTVMAEDGFDHRLDKTIPGLVESGSTYFGRSLTTLAAAECGDNFASTGTLIPDQTCVDLRRRVEGGVMRRPQVTVGPLSTPEPKPKP